MTHIFNDLITLTLVVDMEASKDLNLADSAVMDEIIEESIRRFNHANQSIPRYQKYGDLKCIHRKGKKFHLAATTKDETSNFIIKVNIKQLKK